MNICDYTDRLEIIDGEIVRIINGQARAKKYRDKNLDVYREWENGKCDCRNLYTSMSGYRVAFPDIKTSTYSNGYMPFIPKLEKWAEVDKLSNFKWYSRIVDEETEKVIVSKYPNFKYVLKKWKSTIVHTMEALRIWKEHPEIEMLLSAGFVYVALNRSFWKLSEQKKKEIVLFMRNNPDCSNFKLGDIQTILKYHLTKEQFKDYDHDCNMYGKIAYDIYRYLKKGKFNYSSVSLYRDYAKLLKQTNHNRNEPYWKFPKDLQKKHDEVREEVRRLEELNKLGELRSKQDKYFKAVKKLLKFKMDIDGYTVFVPETIEEIGRQAKVLHQCLITCDYVSSVIRKNCVLVFIQKNGEPIATAELKKDNKIGQFYANELDRHNCLPSDEVRAVMNKWIEMKEAA